MAYRLLGELVDHLRFAVGRPDGHAAAGLLESGCIDPAVTYRHAGRRDRELCTAAQCARIDPGDPGGGVEIPDFASAMAGEARRVEGANLGHAARPGTERVGERLHAKTYAAHGTNAGHDDTSHDDGSGA
ncbi:hypothetical protein D3C71_1528290 [compost metagenome]